MAYIQVEITAEAIAEAMNDDMGFAFEVWEELAERLHMGLMLDNLCDILRGSDPDDAKKICAMLALPAELLKDHFEHAK